MGWGKGGRKKGRRKKKKKRVSIWHGSTGVRWWGGGGRGDQMPVGEATIIVQQARDKMMGTPNGDTLYEGDAGCGTERTVIRITGNREERR